MVKNAYIGFKCDTLAPKCLTVFEHHDKGLGGEAMQSLTDRGVGPWSRWAPSVLLVTLFLTFVSLWGQPEPPALKLKGTTFVPALGEAPAIASHLLISGYAAGERGYYIVQFGGPVQDSWKAELTAAGAELLDYLPEFAFKVRMTPEEARQAEQLQPVLWVGLFHPGYKLSPTLVRDGRNLYTVSLEKGSDADSVAAQVRFTGAEVLTQEDRILLVAATSAQLDAVARVLDVAWIENYRIRERFNQFAAGQILNALAANDAGFDGSTQKVGFADTGLGDGTPAGAHVSIPESRIAAIFDWPGKSNNCYNATNDGSQDVDTGHGTHVVGSALAEGPEAGPAPGAQLVFQSVEDWAKMKGLCALVYPDGYYLIGIPSDIRQLFQQSYNAGARIHSNSWGTNAQGDYTTDSLNADDFIWKNWDKIILFAAGNAGTDANGDGVIDSGSVGSPATAKNVISIGATENDRLGSYPCDTALEYTKCAERDGQNTIFTYGAAWPSRYPAEPIKSDPSAGGAEQMAAFSSRGPTSDGRIKPDVVAPGTWVLSLYSDLFQEGYDPSPNPQNNLFQYDGWGDPESQFHKYLGGTSMSTPLAAGAAAVVRDFYQKQHAHSASAALVKATLINSAVDLQDENNDGVNDNQFPIPNIHEGWGRIDLARATQGTAQFIEETSGLATGGVRSYAFRRETSGSAFKVTLVWSDYPSTTSASKNLVNDLDLRVISPTGTVYLGNVFSGGWSMVNGNPDRLNNVENVYVESAAEGDWTVEVHGHNVPNGRQPYALVIDGTSPGDQAPAVSMVAPANGSTVSGTVLVQVHATDAEDETGTLEVRVSIDGGAWQEAAYNPASGYYELNWETTTVPDGVHNLQASAADSTGKVATSTVVTVTVDNIDDPPVVGIVSPVNGSTVSGTVVIQVNASDDRDAVGSLTVEVSIDGSAWATATYNSGSGYYELSWDTTSAGDGNHTIDARATDSGGNIGNADQIAVTVDNSSDPGDPPGSTSDMYVWDLVFSHRTYGPGGSMKDLTVVVWVKQDSNGNGTAESEDSAVGKAFLKLELSHQSGSSWTFQGETDGRGRLTAILKGAPTGDYSAHVFELVHATLVWNPDLDRNNPNNYTLP